MGVIIVTDKAGVTHELEAVEGWRVMEILRDYKIGVEGTCGGACSCATCHVVIDDEWVSRLHPARDEETDLLDTLPILHDASRLACQIIWDESLNGLKLTVAQA
ncbi:MAG: 2Fe-2S iron-sulfur cluster-binding protein [Hyphomicrobiales bacterium]|nr:2Fe-2S iron-sulfur cluster-binding protein [Hyphomicrobiales bacterium]